MKRKKISIIVPVYNIENYVEQCINSILKQNFKDYELLLIDDGSTDNSGKICDSYNYNKNVQCYHKENGGLSSARNYGIQKSNGEYLMFIDGDDFLENQNCLNEIYRAILKNKSDIIQYKMKYYYQNKNTYKELKDINTVNSKKYFLYIEDMVKNGTLSISACDKVIKADIIKKHNIYFKEGLLSEDVDWSLKLYLKAKTIEPINKNIYVYRQQRKNSITNTKSEKSVESLMYIINKWYSYNYIDLNIKRLYYNYLAYQYLILIVNVPIKKISKDEFYEKKADLLNYSDNRKVKLAVKVKKIFGFRIMICVLKFYNILRQNGIFKI